MTSQTVPTVEALPPGVYLGLNEERYHADPALGSGDIRAVARDPVEFWWDSWMNPNREEREPTPAQVRGTAMHKYVLEGKQGFEGRYMRRPDDPEGASPPEKGALTKKHNAAAAAAGKTLLHGRVHDRIMLASQMILANPHLSQAFQGGISEVSVFWERDGVKLKCRIDFVKPRACTDLKSIVNPTKMEFRERCRVEMMRRKLPMQAEHYLEGRRMFNDFVQQRRVFGTDMIDDGFLSRIAMSSEFAFAFVFFQAEGAPQTWGRQFSPGNELLKIAREQIETALEKYRAYRKKFGTDFWVLQEALGEADETEDFRDRYGMWD